MGKFKRNERVAGIIKILSDNPSELFTLNYFSELFNAAKSTISEDIGAAKKIVEEMSLGVIETIPGAAGGVKYKPIVGKEQSRKFLEALCEKLKEPSRIIPGKFLYMADLIFHPVIAAKVGEIFASHFMDRNADYVVTIETKGITLALMTARALNIPLAIVRRDNRVTEGSTVSINYLSGSSHRIQTMSISKRSITEGARVIVIDDFMKAGGTVKGLSDLMKEFNAEVVGTGIFMTTAEPKEKLVNDYFSLLMLESVNEVTREIKIVSAI